MIFKVILDKSIFFFHTKSFTYYNLYNGGRYNLKNYPEWNWRAPIKQNKNVILAPEVIGWWSDD